MALTAKQKLFADEYLIDLNATQAAIRAGYSAKTAGSIGEENLKKPEVTAYLAERQQARQERTEINADYVLTRLAEIDKMDLLDILNDDGTVKAIKEWPLIWRQYVSGMDVSELRDGAGEDAKISVLKKIKWPDKLKNLELLGKHVTVGAFKDAVDHKHSFIGPDGMTLSFKVVTEYVKPGDV